MKTAPFLLLVVRRGRPKAFLARQVLTSGMRKTAAKTDSSGWRPGSPGRRAVSEAD